MKHLASVSVGIVCLAVMALSFAAQTQLQSSAPIPAASTVVATRPLLQTRPKVPQACLDAAELADEVIARLNRNQRDNRLAEMLRDYTIASQNCRRAASP